VDFPVKDDNVLFLRQ